MCHFKYHLATGFHFKYSVLQVLNSVDITVNLSFSWAFQRDMPRPDLNFRPEIVPLLGRYMFTKDMLLGHCCFNVAVRR